MPIGFIYQRPPTPTVAAPVAPRATSLIMPGYETPQAPTVYPSRLGPGSPGFQTPPSYVTPHPTIPPPPGGFASADPLAGQLGRPAEWLQYDIRNPRFAELLRESFDTSGGSGWKLASEIVPVFVVNESGGAEGGAIPWVWESLLAGAAAGAYAMVKVSNAPDSGRLVTIDAIRAITGGGVFYGVVEPTIRFDAVNDIWTVQAVGTTDTRAGRVQLVLTKGRLDGDADRDAYLVAHPRYFTHLASVVQERTPGIVLSPGQDFILMGGGEVGADLFTSLSLEGTEVPI